jgi:hypothetical protein
MGLTLRRVALLFVASSILLWQGGPASALSDATRADRAVGYMASQQHRDGSVRAFSAIGSTSDAILSIVAAGTGHHAMLKALGYLHSQTVAGHVNTIGLRAKVALALEAAGRNPHSYAGHDLLGEITSTLGIDGRFGSASVLDQSLAILSIQGNGDTAPMSAVNWLTGAQCPDGGWAYDQPYNPADDDSHCLSTSSPSTDYFESDTNTTAYAIQALESAGTSAFGVNPFPFFTVLRDPAHHGWGYTWGFQTTDADSTALVIQAYKAAGKSAPTGSLIALRALQYARCGAFAFTWNGSRRSGPDIEATIGAVPGVLHKAFPYKGAVVGDPPATPACT